MKYVTRNTSVEFYALQARRSSKAKKTVTLCRILKSGKPGKPREYDLFWSEKTAADVIARLESYNPGDRWVEA